jgi:hypothetical protein
MYVFVTYTQFFSPHNIEQIAATVRVVVGYVCESNITRELLMYIPFSPSFLLVS